MVEKKNININFAQGVDTKTDPKQVAIGKFLSMENSVFKVGQRLTKRNGNQEPHISSRVQRERYLSHNP